MLVEFFESLESRVAAMTDVCKSSCGSVNPGRLFTLLAELRVAPEEQHVYKFESEVADYTCPVLSMENTFSVHATVETTLNIVEITTVQELVIWQHIPEIRVVGRTHLTLPEVQVVARSHT